LVEGHLGETKFQPGLLNLKAIIQYFGQGLLNNRLYKWQETLRKPAPPSSGARGA
jgi:hypothetical protein